MDEVDIKSSIEEYKDEGIGQMLADQMGYTMEGLHNVVNKLKAMCEKRNIVSVLMEVSGNATSESQADEIVEELLAEAKEWLPYLGTSEITLTTDKAGNASVMSFKLDIELESNLNGIESVIGGTIIKRTNTIIIKGDGTIKFNDTYESTLGELPGQISQLIDKLTLKDGQTFEGRESGEQYIIYKAGKDTFIAYKHESLPNVRYANNKVSLGQETIGGVTYDKYTVYYGWMTSSDKESMSISEDYVWYFGEDANVMTNGKCGNWTEYNLLGQYGYAYYTVWALSDGTVARFEFDFETTKDLLRGNDSFYLWYNNETGEISKADVHDYQLINSTVTGEGCDQVTTKYYECSICHGTDTRKTYKSHNMQERMELVEGATSCDDGWRRVYACANCDYVEAENYYQQGHQWQEQRLRIETECGVIEIMIQSCACGYYNYWDKWVNSDWHIEGDCDLRAYNGKVDFDKDGFPISSANKRQCVNCGVVIELLYEDNNEDGNGKYDKYYRSDVAVKDESGEKVEVTDKNENGYYPEGDYGYGEIVKPGYPEGDMGENYPTEKPDGEWNPDDKYEEEFTGNCYSTGSAKILVNGVVVFEQAYDVAHHMYVNYNEEYVDGYRVATETCQCGAVLSTSKMDDMGRTVYYVNEKGVGYRQEYNGCEVT